MIELRKLSLDDGEDIYEMIQEIPESENGYQNNAKGKTFDEFKLFIKKRYEESLATELVDGWKVPSTKYWLYVDGKPVGMGDIRHFLTPALREAGGNIGYSIRPSERGKGYGFKLLELLLSECAKMGMEKVLITIKQSNSPSIRVAEKNGGLRAGENEERIFFWVPLKDFSDVCLEGEDIVLKKAKFDDWESMYNNLWKHPESAKYMYWSPTESEGEAKDRMIRTITYEKIWKYALLIYLKETGEAIGFAGMKDLEDGTFEETGVAIGPAFIRKGYGRQVLNLLLDEAQRMGAVKFIASNRDCNIASRELQRVCGFSFERLSEEFIDPRTGDKYFLEYNIKYLR